MFVCRWQNKETWIDCKNYFLLLCQSLQMAYIHELLDKTWNILRVFHFHTVLWRIKTHESGDHLVAFMNGHCCRLIYLSEEMSRIQDVWVEEPDISMPLASIE